MVLVFAEFMGETTTKRSRGKKMKIPKKLKVCGRVYAVEFQNKHKKGFLGETKHISRKIIIYRYSDGEKVDPDLFGEIFIHEIIHCVNAVFSIPMTESNVERLSGGLCGVLKDNGLLNEPGRKETRRSSAKRGGEKEKTQEIDRQ